MSTQAAQRVKDILEEILSTPLGNLGDRGALRQRIDELQASLNETQTFVASLEAFVGQLDGRALAPVRRGFGGRATAARVTPSRAPAQVRRSGGVRRSGRGPGEFASTPFILQAVKDAGQTGIRPREIVAQIQTAAPGHHVRPSALVSTILTRLKRRGEVRRRAGKWFAAA